MVSDLIDELMEEINIASMEPCLFRHGKGDSTYNKMFIEFGFNGAMSFQTW